MHPQKIAPKEKNLAKVDTLFPRAQHVGNGIMLEVELGRHPRCTFGKNSVINTLGTLCTIPENSIIPLPPDTPKGGEEG